MQIEVLKQQIENHIKCYHIAVDGDGHHFQATIVSSEFEGLSRVKQQQKVYACVQAWINSGELHALSLQTFTVQEWQAHG